MDRKFILLCAAAIPLGLAGGYAWSALTAPAVQTKPPKATMGAVPASPEELPEASDYEWATRSDDARASAPDVQAAPPVHYAGCNAVRAAGKAPLHEGDPGYRADMDGDGDGIACEPYRGR